MPTKTHTKEAVIIKYNQLLAAAKKLKMVNADLTQQNIDLKRQIAELPILETVPVASDTQGLIEMYEERITRVIRLIKDPNQDPHSMSPRLANILRPPS